MVYNDYKLIVHNTIYNMIKNTEITEDLTSDVFIKLFKNIEKYKENISFKSWVKTMATNLTIDYIRRSNTKNTINTIDDDESKITITDHKNPESDVIRIESCIEVKESLKKLSPLYKDVLYLRYYENKSYEEIAESLKIPVGTVKARLNKGKLKLKQLINN